MGDIRDLVISAIFCEILQKIVASGGIEEFDKSELSDKLDQIQKLLRDSTIEAAWQTAARAFSDRLFADRNRKSAEIFWDEYSKQGISSSKEDLAQMILDNDPKTHKLVVNFILQSAATSKALPYAIKFGEICRSIEKTFGVK